MEDTFKHSLDIIEKARIGIDQISKSLRGSRPQRTRSGRDVSPTRAGLVAKKVLVNKDGKSFYQTVYVRAGEKASISEAHKNFSAVEHEEAGSKHAELSKKTKSISERNLHEEHANNHFAAADDMAHTAKPAAPTTTPEKVAPKQNTTASAATEKKVVGHESFDHPNGGKINKGDKVTFDHRGEMKSGTVVKTNVYQRFANPYVLMKGSDGKTYELVISKVNIKTSNSTQQPLDGNEVAANKKKIDDNLNKKIKLMEERKAEAKQQPKRVE